MSADLALPHVIIGISCGDLNGIGMEVVMKTLDDPMITEFCTPVLFASSKAVGYHRKALDMQHFSFQIVNQAEEIQQHKNNLVNVWSEIVNLEFGKLTDEVGGYALKSIDAAVAAHKAGLIDALVTAPIHKANIKLEDQKFTGHTGYLGSSYNQKPMMILVNEGLRVALVTEHVPISGVAELITEDRVASAIRLLNKSLQRDFGVLKPRIAVLGLNPHAGDEGLLGHEEQESIAPAIASCAQDGILAAGPFAADGFFGSGKHTKFDAILAMYHDQGLVPFKALSFGSGVNVTVGLDLVRTSPDHGVGFDIAGQGKADANSFRQALFAAIDIARNRKMDAEIRINPLVAQQAPH
jgi:4-phospho-D-threonate 3-dehydrogenase / 4-phospho-D-erythronate 3-dehydrogenase